MVSRSSMRPSSMRAVRRDETSRRIPGSGDDFQMTWAADDRQYAALCDGAGFRLPPTTFYNSRLIAVAGGPEEAVFDELATYPMLTGVGRHYGFGTLAVRGRFYQYLSGPPVAFPDAAETGTVFDGVKLIYSDDAGRTWRNQDGSTPVRWETYDERSRENLVFFREPNGAFALTSILQMGRDYAANRDGYVYVYSPGGIEDGTMNRLAMFRVPVDRMLDRTAYEYFVDRTEDGRATWSTDIARYGAVHVFPTGWVNRLVHPWAWIPSVAYVEPLGLYLMTSWGTGIGSRGEWFGKPSYLGIWAAERPWGPWTQILEEQAWTPGGDPGARAYHPVIAPKWIAADGRSFWLVWTDFQTVPVPGFDDFVEPVNRARATGEWAEFAALQQRAQPGYTFNLQRVDIVDETESRR